jgi:hypothetical protein
MLVSLLVASSSSAQTPLRVESQTIVVDPSAPKRTRFTRATLLAALVLRSADPRFGGLSGLSPIGPDRLLAVSDRSGLLALRLRLDRGGRLLGIAEASLRPLPRGDRLTLDAESIARDRDGSTLVGVEGRHGLLRYRSLAAAPVELELPSELAAAPRNGGLEAVTVLADGRILLLCERCPDPEGMIRGWIGQPRAFSPLRLRAHDGFVPTDLAALPDGGVLLLERHYTPARGSRARVRRLSKLRAGGPPIDGEEILRLERPLAVDNFEGIALQRVGARTRFLLVSDDNFDRREQRTLLYQLELR